MAITFAPKRGAILMCDFELAYITPEMRKTRQVAVVSVLSNNQRHALAPGTATVIPFSTVPPASPGVDDIFIPKGTYWSLTKDSWARCKMVTTVSHSRLDLILRNNRRHPSEFLSEKHLKELAEGLAFALGL
jgi:uncharacterized protein YifN (PemK superfamily)